MPTWDWRHRSDLYSGKHADTGFNLQIAATLGGDLVAVGAPVPGARHDTHAWQAGGLAQRLAGMDRLGDLGYVGCEMLTGTRKPPGGELTNNQNRSTQTCPASAPPSNAPSHTSRTGKSSPAATEDLSKIP